MRTENDWRERIQVAANDRPASLSATTFLQKLGTASKPVKVVADDGNIYLVKGRQNGRMIVNEQVVAVLGTMLGAPVAPVAFVDVPQVLISAEPEMQHLQPGVSHGSAWIDNCTDLRGIAYTDVAGNRERFAALTILYSWIGANDHQWIYSKASPNLVHSADHGHFFPGGPNWTNASLRGASNPVLDQKFASCGLRAEDFVEVQEKLLSMPYSAMAVAVARPWYDWQITEDERVALAVYLDDRRIKLVEVLKRKREGESLW